MLPAYPQGATMTVFPGEIESERLHPADFDPFELYEYAREGAPHIDEVTDHVAWSPYEHPNQAFEWVERCGERFENGDAATRYGTVSPGRSGTGPGRRESARVSGHASPLQRSAVSRADQGLPE